MSINSSDYIAFVQEQLAPIRDLSSRRFFGGVGLKAEGAQFALLMGNTLFFVVDDSTRAGYEAMGSHCFHYDTRKGRVDVKKYYAVPEDVLEDPSRLLGLARASIQIALKTRPRR